MHDETLELPDAPMCRTSGAMTFTSISCLDEIHTLPRPRVVSDIEDSFVLTTASSLRAQIDLNAEVPK